MSTLFLGDKDYENIIVNYITNHGPATEEELFKVTRIMEEMAIQASIFRMVLENKIGITDINNDKLVFVRWEHED